MFREFTNAKGDVVSEVSLGDEVHVRLRIRAVGRARVYNLVLVDLLPAGFDVVLNRGQQQGIAARLGVGGSSWQPVYGDAREDRVVEVCSVSGHLPGPHCKHRHRTHFIPGISPIKVCDIHREVHINTQTGLRACDPVAEPTETSIFEVWPTDLARAFKRAGMPRVEPPPWPAACDPEGLGAVGQVPDITSPQPQLTYQVRMGEVGKQTLPLTANSDGDVQSLYWFADGRYLSKVARGKPFYWTLYPGTYRLRVVDDRGRFDSRELRVVLSQ